MTAKIAYPREEALARFEGLRNEIAHHCDRFELAGSLRRGKELVGDIEVVCIPKFEFRTDPRDLFGDTTVQINRQFERVSDLRTIGVLQDRLGKDGKAAFGQRYQRVKYGEIPVDIFCVLPPADWGVIFTIRTGPADFNLRLVKSRLQGGLLPPGMAIKDGRLIEGGAKHIPCPEERDFFKAIGLEWREPEDRI